MNRQICVNIHEDSFTGKILLSCRYCGKPINFYSKLFFCIFICNISYHSVNVYREPDKDSNMYNLNVDNEIH